MSIIEDLVTDALRSAPELTYAPSLVSPLVQAYQPGGDMVQQSQALAHSSDIASAQQAAQRVSKHHGGIFGDALNSIGHGFRWLIQHNPLLNTPQKITPEQVQQNAAQQNMTPDEYLQSEAAAGRPIVSRQAADAQYASNAVAGANAAKILNAPLAEVQHQYRYLRDVQQTHGTVAFLSELGAIAGGAAAGGAAGYFATGGSALGAARGATLGAEATADVTGRLMYPDSWARTANGENYRDARGEPVSPGRDIASLGTKPGTAPYTAISAISDGLFDLFGDPVANAAGIAHLPGTPNPSRALQTADDVDRLLAKTPQRTMAVFSDMASKNAGEVARAYPAFSWIAPELGAAQSPEEVADAIKNSLLGAEMRGTILPSRPSQILPAVAELPAAGEEGRIHPWQSFLRKATTKLPMTLDPDSLELSNHEIDPASNAPDQLEAVRRSLLMSRTPESVVNKLMDEYASAQTSGQRIAILRNGWMRTALSVLPSDVAADVETQQRLRDMIAHSTGGAGAGVDDVYVFNKAGGDLSRITTAHGDTAAGVWLNQRGNITAPDWVALQRWGREAKGSLSLYGKIDDGLYSNLIVPFKRAALLTGGFGLRVGMAEAIPAALRNGLIDTVKAAIAAKRPLYPEITDAEVPDLTDAVLHSLNASDPAAAEKALGDLNLRELAGELAMRNNSHILPPALQMGNYVGNDLSGRVEAMSHDIFKAAQTAPGWRETDAFGNFRPGSQNFHLYWQRAIREMANDAGAQQIAGTYLDAIRRGLSEEAATRLAIDGDVEFLRELPDLERTAFTRASSTADDPIREWATTRVEGFKGLTHSPDFATAYGNSELPTGDPHIPIIHAVSMGETPSLDVLKAVEANDLPLQVKGRIMVQDTSGNLLARIANKGFGKVLGPIVNTLGREHQYLLAVQDELPKFQDLIDAGMLSRDEALDQAQYNATQKVLRFVHNPEERTQLSVILRNFIPFYFAQEQSYRRLGRLLEDDPAAFRKYTLMLMGMRNYTQQVQDDSGTQHVALPGLGLLNEGTLALMDKLHLPVLGAVPTIVTGNVTSLNTVFPFAEGVRPSLSPLVTVPAHALMSLDPALTPAVSSAIGGAAANSQVWEQLIPNTPVRNLFKAIGPGQDMTSAYQSSLISTLQWYGLKQDEAMAKWTAAGHSPDDPNAPHIIPPDLATTSGGPATLEAQKFVDRLKNQTRINLVMKAVISAFSPFAPSLAIGDVKLNDELNKLIKAQGVSAGIQAFLDKHPDATAYTVFKSSSTTGAYIPANKTAEDWINAHADLMNNYRNAAVYLVPQDASGKYDSAIYNEQIAQGLRTRRNGEQWARAFYIAEGDHVFYDQALPEHKRMLQQANGDPDATKAENSNFSAWLNNYFGPAHPVWWDDFKSANRDHARQIALAQLEEIYAKGLAPKDSQSQKIAGLLKDWQTHQTELLNGKLNGWSADERDASNNNFLSYLENIVKDHPELEMVINRLFRPESSKIVAGVTQ